MFLAEHTRPVGIANGQILLECQQYDPAHQACRAYEDRPSMCSGFPWYGEEPPGHAAPNPQCSYLLDVPPSQRPEGSRPLIPLTPV